MEIKDINTLLNSLLTIESPWYLSKVDLQVKNKVLDIHLDIIPGSKFNCVQCEQECSVYDTSVKRIRHLDLFEFQCYVNIRVPRTNCPKDGVKVFGATKLFRQGSHYSYLFEDKIMRLCTEMSMKAISTEINEPDSNLWRVFKHYTKKGIDTLIDLSTTTRIAVDETAIRRGHSYVTIFTDMDSGDVILVEEGRKKEVFGKLQTWLFEKGGRPKYIELMSMDMSKSYKAGHRDYFGSAEVVFDRFHIKKALNESVDAIRRQELVHCEQLKNTKYLWLKNESTLNAHEKAKLATFLEEGTTNTAIAYQLKIAFDQLWKVQKHAVEPMLEKWIATTLSYHLKPLNDFVNTIYNNYKGIMLSFKTNITNALSEGINSVVQLVKARARGYRNIDNFMAMIYFIGNSQIYATHDK
jgi:transposase